MLEGASAHHGIAKWTVARRLDDTQARVIARAARNRVTTLFSSVSVLSPCIRHLLGSSEPNRTLSLSDCALHPSCRWESAREKNLAHSARWLPDGCTKSKQVMMVALLLFRLLTLRERLDGELQCFRL